MHIARACSIPQIFANGFYSMNMHVPKSAVAIQKTHLYKRPGRNTQYCILVQRELL